MFEIIAARAGSRARSRPAVALAASVAVHAAIVAAIFTLSWRGGFAQPLSQTRAATLRLRAVTLVAPVAAALPQAAPLAAQVAEPTANKMPRAVLSAPRRFRSPAPSPAPAPHGELVLAPAIEVLPAALLLPPALSSPIAAAPAPPLRTDNLTASQVLAPLALPSAVVQPAGFNAASSAAAPTRGSLRVAGFESATATGDAPPRRPALPLANAGFGDAVVTTAAAGDPLRGAPTELALTRPLEILSKPKPAYTEEARRRRIEGEVLLEILFSAAGRVRFLAMVRGLGHGLDENAIAAAEGIRFRPAERAGVPADSTAIVHIVFHLAY